MRNKPLHLWSFLDSAIGATGTACRYFRTFVICALAYRFFLKISGLSVSSTFQGKESMNIRLATVSIECCRYLVKLTAVGDSE